MTTRDANLQETITARASRRYWVGLALASAIGVWIGFGNAVARGGAGYVVMGVVSATCLAASLRTAVRRPQAFSVSDSCFVVGKRTVPWGDVAEILLAVHGDDRTLTLKLQPGTPSLPHRLITTNATNPSEVVVPLNHLSISWGEVVRSIEATSGKPVHQVEEGPVGRRRPP